jgi:hypothetical protein
LIDLDPEEHRIEIDAKKLRELLIGVPAPRGGAKNIH